MTQQLWNREELYAEVWEQPLTKLAEKYGISGVAIGKICRKLKVPLPGRGYWARKQFGQNPKKLPLPRFDNPPRLTRFIREPKPPVETNSADPELVKIAEVEATAIVSPSEEHKLIVTARRILSRVRTDEDGRCVPPKTPHCLDIRVSKELLERALTIMNTVLFTLDSLGLPVTIGEKGTTVEAFGEVVPFRIEEDLRVKGHREETSYSGRARQVPVYERSGQLAFRISTEGHGERRHWGDGKSKKLEDLLPKCVGGLLRVGRQNRLAAEERRRWQLHWEQQERERQERARKAQEEASRLRNLEECAANWNKAEQLRAFIAAFQRSCEAKGESVAPDSPNGQWVEWARKKADWFDPLVDKSTHTHSPHS